MRKISALLLSAALLSGAAAQAAPGPKIDEAILTPRDDSGISAVLKFTSDKRGPVYVTGIAKGLTPGQDYVSLVYDTRILRGPDACVGALKIIGTWKVHSDGTGILVSLLPIRPGFARTASIRLSPPANVEGNLQACGPVRREYDSGR